MSERKVVRAHQQGTWGV